MNAPHPGYVSQSSFSPNYRSISPIISLSDGVTAICLKLSLISMKFWYECTSFRISISKLIFTQLSANYPIISAPNDLRPWHVVGCCSEFHCGHDKLIRTLLAPMVPEICPNWALIGQLALIDWPPQTSQVSYATHH